MSVRSSRRLNKNLSPPEMESKSGPLSTAKTTRSARKVRKTNDLLFFSFNASTVEKEDENSKSTSSKGKKQNLPRLEFDESGNSDKGNPFSFKEVQKTPPPPVPKNKKRKIVKAKRVLRCTKQYEVENKCNDETLNITTKKSSLEEKLFEKVFENSVNLANDGERSSISLITVKEKTAQDEHMTEVSPSNGIVFPNFVATTSKQENKLSKTPKTKNQNLSSLELDESGKVEFSSFREIENAKSVEEPSENCKSVNLSPVDDEGSSSYIEVKEKSIIEISPTIDLPMFSFVASTAKKKNKISKTLKIKKENLSSVEVDGSGKGEFSSFREIENSKSVEEPSENCKPVNLSSVDEGEGSSSYIKVKEKSITEKISPSINLPMFCFVASTAKKENKISKTSKIQKQNLSVIDLDDSGNNSEESFSFKEIENSNKHGEENEETFNVKASNSYLERKPIKQPSENCKNHDKGSSSYLEVNDSNMQGEQLISKISQTTASDQLSEKKESFGSTLIVSVLPSPISPSTQSYLSVHSTEERVQPSLNGSSDGTSIRRRTYELENSVNDISLLKSVSEKDVTKSSLCDNNSEESVTPQLMFSKVTQRKRWNKVNNTPFQIKGSPRWIISSRPSTSKSKLSTPGVTKPLFSPKLMSNAPKHSSKKNLSNVKVPDFAAIHKRAMDRIENIVEYKLRKEERAKMLISGKKPQKQVEKSEKAGRKQLRFAPDTAEKDKSLTFIPLPSTPLPKGVKKDFDESLASENDNYEEEVQPPVFKFPKPTFAFETKIRSPIFKFTKPTFTIEERSVLEKKINNLATHIPRMKKTNFGFLRSEANDERRVLVEKNCNINKFGTSNPSHAKSAKAQVRNEEIKSVATKSKPVKNTLEARKCTIKGVRSNRRFELLMNMRKGK